jgi:hypothetical protein
MRREQNKKGMDGLEFRQGVADIEKSELQKVAVMV